MRRNPFVLAILCVILLGQFLPRVNAQAALRRLTTTGDVMEFVWASRGDSLYVTRAGSALNLSPTRRQITGDLFRVNAAEGASEMLARNANNTRVPFVGDEIAFTRMNPDGTARAIVYNPRSKQELDVGENTFGAAPQWNGEGGTLLFLQDGKMRRVTRTERATLYANQSFPNNARVSASGERVAFLDASGLWVTQGNSLQLVARNENGATILPHFVWSNAGDKLAFMVTHDGFKPKVWIADTTRGAAKKIAEGELEWFANLAWSPDDTFVIFTRTPTGSSAANNSEIWRARADGADTHALIHNRAAETLPQFSPDGKSIAFLRDGDVWVMDLNAQGMPMDASDAAQTVSVDYKTPRSPDAQRTPPATIRVKHDAANACRSAPVGQIEALDFETYVKR
ncbi:MAG: hypothetical protein L0Y55_15270, partial [Anaerolineales bacterium]|nr:hypothetical protein [Anaerolineales bacterium]